MAEIKCSHTAVWPIEKFKPHPKNPNQHGPEQIRLLGKCIATSGWRSPIVVSKLSGYVIKGHGRLYAARALGLLECPVDEQSYKDESQELSDMIADNRLSELSEMDIPELKDLLQELDTGAIDMELTGFTDDAMALLMSQVHIEKEEKKEEEKADDIKCPKCGYILNG